MWRQPGSVGLVSPLLDALLRVVQHKHFTFTFEDLPGHGLHEFAFPRAQAPYLQVFLDSSEATAELGIVTTVEDPMKSTSSMYINCVDATRRYIAWSAARGEVFEAYQQLALLAQVSLPRAFTGRGAWLARSSLGTQIRGDAVLLAPCLRMVRCIVGRLSQLSSATAVVRLFVQHVSASEALMSKVGRPWRRGFGLWLRLCALICFGWRRQVGRQRLIGQLEDFRKQVRCRGAAASPSL